MVVGGEVTPAGPTIRGNCEKGEEDELTGTLAAVFLLILLFFTSLRSGRIINTD
jgi:hypothetical protein